MAFGKHVRNILYMCISDGCFALWSDLHVRWYERNIPVCIIMHISLDFRDYPSVRTARSHRINPIEHDMHVHLSFTLAQVASMHMSCQIRIFSEAHDKAPAASDSTTITRDNRKLKRAHLLKILGVAPTPSVSVIIEAGASHATLGKG